MQSMSNRAKYRILAIVATLTVLSGCAPSASTPTSSAPVSAPPASASASAALASATPLPLPQGSEPVDLDPALFAGVAIDHPFWPMAVGSRWVYAETNGEGNEQRVEVTVLDETKEIVGIQAQVVHDIVTLGGETVEDTIDWYAQDSFGNLWYLGEDTKEYEGGEVVSTEGSWETGVDGAQAGIILPANPQVGMTYRQEYYAGQAEDAAEILSLDERVDAPAGTYDGCLLTRDFTPLDPEIEEQKFYASGVGPVQVIQTKGGTSTEKLIEFTPGR
jgi:ABC-type Fe3+-hydroxamate transport system substrate-binding protein